MINIKTPEEIEILREGGRILAGILREVAKSARPGISARELSELAERLIERSGGKPSFKGYAGYPDALCVSVNNQVVHGVPAGETILREGDIAGLDLGLEYKGYFTDMAVTVGIGKASKEAGKLMKAARKALDIGIKKVRPGGFIGDIGFAVQRYVKGKGFSVVRDLVGHGVGNKVHEEPMVPNFGNPGSGPRLQPGMVIAIEPMINAGTHRVKTLDDGWTVVTADGSLSAHFEHTVAVTERGHEVLTR